MTRGAIAPEAEEQQAHQMGCDETPVELNEMQVLVVDRVWDEWRRKRPDPRSWTEAILLLDCDEWRDELRAKQLI
jgi:hypothetical protein